MKQALIIVLLVIIPSIQNIPLYGMYQCLAPKTQLKNDSYLKILPQKENALQINIENLISHIDQYIEEGNHDDSPERLINSLKNSQKGFFKELEESSKDPETIQLALNILLWDLYQTRLLEAYDDPIYQELLSSSEKVEEVSLNTAEKLKLSGFLNNGGFETLEWPGEYNEYGIPEYYYTPFKHKQMSSIFFLGRRKRVVLQRNTPYVRLYEKGKQIYKKTNLNPIQRRRFRRLKEFPPRDYGHAISGENQNLKERLLETTTLERRYLEAARCFISLLDNLYFKKKFSVNPFSLNEEDLLDIFSKMAFKPGNTVLEIGPGAQPISFILAMMGAKVYLLESPKLIKGNYQAFIQKLIDKITPLIQRSQGSITLLPGNISEPSRQSFPNRVDHVIALDVLRPDPHPFAMIYESQGGSNPYFGIADPQSLKNAFSYIFSTQPKSFYISHPDTTNSVYGYDENPYTEIFKDQNFHATPLEVPIPRSNLNKNGYIYLAPKQVTQLNKEKPTKLKPNATYHERFTHSLNQLKSIQSKSQQIHEIALSLSEVIQNHPSWIKATKPKLNDPSRFSTKLLIGNILNKAA